MDLGWIWVASLMYFPIFCHLFFGTFLLLSFCFFLFFRIPSRTLFLGSSPSSMLEVQLTRPKMAMYFGPGPLEPKVKMYFGPGALEPKELEMYFGPDPLEPKVEMYFGPRPMK